MKIVVVGGTGLIGSQVVSKLNEAGHQAVAAAPNTGVDTITGEGLAGVLAEASAVVDVANSPSFEDAAVLNFFQTSTRNILDAALESGVSHYVALSIVGTERLPDSGYMRAKVAQEQLIQTSSMPFTLIHATQFFEFLRGIAQSGESGGVIRLPDADIQPIAAENVAAMVAEAVVSSPVNATIEVGGPERFAVQEIIRRVLDHDGNATPVVADAQARYFGAALQRDSLVPGPDARLGQTDFAWWIENVPPPSTH
jgi:uncharacterized protein YbjT (DUF2867 family)